MMKLKKKVPTNFVPAVAVKRRGPVLIILIGRKGCVDGCLRLKKNTTKSVEIFYYYLTRMF